MNINILRYSFFGIAGGQKADHIFVKFICVFVRLKSSRFARQTGHIFARKSHVARTTFRPVTLLQVLKKLSHDFKHSIHLMLLAIFGFKVKQYGTFKAIARYDLKLRIIYLHSFTLSFFHSQTHVLYHHH